MGYKGESRLKGGEKQQQQGENGRLKRKKLGIMMKCFVKSYFNKSGGRVKRA